MRIREIRKEMRSILLWLVILFLFSSGLPARATAETINYTYDDAYRLTQVASDIGYVEAYTYDEVGNRLTFALSAANISLSQTSFDLGSTNVGVPVTQRYTLTNNGTMALVISAMTISGPGALRFSRVPHPLPAGERVTIFTATV